MLLVLILGKTFYLFIFKFLFYSYVHTMFGSFLPLSPRPQKDILKGERFIRIEKKPEYKEKTF
jgi:hypothetical protein